jgi:peptidoglycan/LPS O-acetylase OafA/YrhL
MSSSLDTSWVRRGRVPSLDGYRGIGTLFIIFAHSTNTARIPIPVPEQLYQWVPWGMIAVHHFFVLSGFLITLLLLREWNTHGRISLGAFYRRRILRLMPPYAAYLIVMALLQFAGVLIISRTGWLGALTYSINFHHCREVGWELGHFWTLSVEEHFYFVWPVILALLGLTWGRWALAVCLLFAPLMRYVSSVYWSNYWNVDFCTFSYVDMIAFGAGLAFLCQSERFHRLTARLQPISGWLLICAGVGLIGSAWLAQQSWHYDLLVHHTVTGFLCATMIYLSAGFSNKWVRRVLDWRPFVSIGVVSYSLYIWQQLFTGQSGLPLWCSTWPVNIFFIATAGMLSYFLIERPFLRIKDRNIPKNMAPSVKPGIEAGAVCVA